MKQKFLDLLLDQEYSTWHISQNLGPLSLLIYDRDSESVFELELNSNLKILLCFT